MTSLLIKNGHVIDPVNGMDTVCDIYAESGIIQAVGKNVPQKAEMVIDANNLVVLPGLVDLQVHAREPGREDRETLETMANAALAGGVTAAVVMPNTSPIADNQTVIEFVIKRARELDKITIYPTGSITREQKGCGLSEMAELQKAGAVAVTDDGVDVQDEGLLRHALEYAATLGLPVMCHSENDALTADGVMHEGWMSTRLGLPGTPAESEDMAIFKNILLAEQTGAHVHLLHVSTARAAELIAAAKARARTRITAEISVQHFALSDAECAGYNTDAKMYPPLRSEDHVKAMIQAIKDKVFDAFTTDHAPHIEPDKLEPFEHAAFGSIGLETSLAVMNTYLVKPGHIPLAYGVRKMTCDPGRVLGLPNGTLSVGAVADLVLFDPKKEWIVDRAKSFSKSRNCVFHGKRLTGQVVATLTKGRVLYRDGQILG